jgi:4-hydroxy-3-methylbut-2-enyl diphosphate reductase
MDENDIDESWFSNIESVGISAGASTPDNIIERVINKVKTISRINKKEEIYE